MNRPTRMMLVFAMAGVLSWGISSTALALGFRNPDQGARATGQGEAFVAQADDASAIYYNPAGLTQVTGTQVTSGGNLLFRNIKFSGAAGQAEMSDTSFVPHLYAASDFGLAKWRFGVGLNVPFGNTMNWGKNTPFQYLLTKSSLMVQAITPTVAYQFNEHLSLGVGLNIYMGDTELNFDYTPLIPGSTVHFHGYGNAVGATVGLLWKITEQHAIGVVYRSPFAINFDGHAQVAAAGPYTTAAAANASLNFPQSVTAGYAFRPTPKLKLEVDVDWTNWDTLNVVRLHTADVIIGSDPRSRLAFNWLDSWYYEFGAQYDLSDNWVARGGYIYSENSVPTSTFSPNLPDGNRHVFSVGLGYNSKKPILFSKVAVSVDLVYQYAFTEARTINGGSLGSPYVDGTWKSDSHAVMITSTLKF